MSFISNITRTSLLFDLYSITESSYEFNGKNPTGNISFLSLTVRPVSAEIGIIITQRLIQKCPLRPLAEASVSIRFNVGSLTDCATGALRQSDVFEQFCVSDSCFTSVKILNHCEALPHLLTLLSVVEGVLQQ